MKVTIPYHYTETMVPYRCRKPRPVEFDDGELTVEIREVTASEAPVAISEIAQGINKGATVDYRWYDGKLYVDQKLTAHDRFRELKHNPFWQYDTPDAKGYHGRSYGSKSKVEREEDIIKWSERFLYVDGILYVTHGEPRYVVMTFGLGCNHGGTSLSIAYHYNPNIAHSAYFPLTQREEAIKAAEATALGRGDNESVPIKVYSDFEIFIPEAIQVNPAIQHGDGDPFINKIENLITTVKNPVVAGLSMMSHVTSELDGMQGVIRVNNARKES